jgi:hypothetical protein
MKWILYSLGGMVVVIFIIATTLIIISGLENRSIGYSYATKDIKVSVVTREIDLFLSSKVYVYDISNSKYYVLESSYDKNSEQLLKSAADNKETISCLVRKFALSYGAVILGCEKKED